MQSDVMGRSKSTEWLGGDTSDAGGGQSSYSELAIEAGVMLRLWSSPGEESTNRCCTPDAMAQARRVAAQLGIPFYRLPRIGPEILTRPYRARDPDCF